MEKISNKDLNNVSGGLKESNGRDKSRLPQICAYDDCQAPLRSVDAKDQYGRPVWHLICDNCHTHYLYLIAQMGPGTVIKEWKE